MGSKRLTFRTINGLLDVSPQAFGQASEDEIADVFLALKDAFAQTQGFIVANEPPYGYKHRVSRSARTLEPRMLACLKAIVLHDRIGTFGSVGRDDNGEVSFSLFVRFAKILNADGLADVETADYGGSWKGAFPAVKQAVKGNAKELWAETIDNFGGMKERGHPIGIWIFEQRPSTGGQGWADSR